MYIATEEVKISNVCFYLAKVKRRTQIKPKDGIRRCKEGAIKIWADIMKKNTDKQSNEMLKLFSETLMKCINSLERRKEKLLISTTSSK